MTDDLPEVKVHNKGVVALVGWMGNDATICEAARVSYGKAVKKPSNDRDLIRYMMRNRHSSPFEHVMFRFYVKAPLFVLRQWHRHRTWSYNEISGRYSEMKDEFFVPEEHTITKQSAGNKQGGSEAPVAEAALSKSAFEAGQRGAIEEYKEHLNWDMRKELARINLPLSLYTEMYATVDLHNLFHFLGLRMDLHAQLEIRDYAFAIYELIRPIVPLAAEAFVDYQLKSIRLSRLEIEAIRTGQPILSDNKREQEEFEAKRRQLGLTAT